MEKASRLDSMLLVIDTLSIMSWSLKPCDPMWPQFWRHCRVADTGIDPPAMDSLSLAPCSCSCGGMHYRCHLLAPGFLMCPAHGIQRLHHSSTTPTMILGM